MGCQMVSAQKAVLPESFPIKNAKLSNRGQREMLETVGGVYLIKLELFGCVFPALIPDRSDKPAVYRGLV